MHRGWSGRPAHGGASAGPEQSAALVQRRPSKEEGVLTPTAGVREGSPGVHHLQLQSPAGSCTALQHGPAVVHVEGNPAPCEDLNPRAEVRKGR